MIYMIKTTSFKLDSELLKRIKIKATEKEITQSELVTTYLLNGLKQDETEYDIGISELENKLNIKSENHSDNIDFEIPSMLKYNPNKISKPITEEPIILEKDNSSNNNDIFSAVIGIVSSPTRTNSVELKKELYNG